MPKRDSHLFSFGALAIAKAAATEAEYHRSREAYWTDEFEAAAKTVDATCSARVELRDVTGGRQAQVVVNYGDPAAYSRMIEAQTKRERHRLAAERFESDRRLYESQRPTGALSVERFYELDADDVHHFRLGGAERED